MLPASRMSVLAIAHTVGWNASVGRYGVERLPIHPNGRIDELLSHRRKQPDGWHPADASVVATTPSRGHG